MICCYVSKTGNREINEDSFICADAADRTMCIVADGLGGHGQGEVASAIAVKTMEKVFLESADFPLDECLDRAILKAQEAILAEQERMHLREAMKTTVVALCGDKKQVCWAHVGDSRLYAFLNNKVKIRTLDHSVPQMLVLSREIPERKIRNHPQRNLLLRVLGVEWDRPKHEVSEMKPLEEYQAFLLCSDGFWELIHEWEMCRLLRKSKSPNEWLDKMVEIVENNGKKKTMDNYTAIAVWM